MECGDLLETNNGSLYTAKTAPSDELPPVPSDDCAAGYLVDEDNNSITDAIHLRIINGTGKESSELSYYSINGIWLITLAQAREVLENGDTGGYFSYNPGSDTIHLWADAGLEYLPSEQIVAISQAYGLTMVIRKAGVDSTPPQVSIVYPGPGEYVRGTITPSGKATDESGIASVTIQIGSSQSEMINYDGSSDWNYTFDTTTKADGAYTLTVTAKDSSANANQVQAVVTVTIDNTLPLINVSGLSDGTYYHTAVQPQITITDSNLLSSSITLNGNSFSSGQSITANGSYTLTISAEDRAGNNANTELTFTIDTNNEISEDILTIIPSTVNFGDVPVGHSRTRTFVIKNESGIDLSIDGLDINESNFTLAMPSIIIGPGKSHHVEVTFTPQAETSQFLDFTITGNGSSQVVRLEGKGRLMKIGRFEPIL